LIFLDFDRSLSGPGGFCNFDRADNAVFGCRGRQSEIAAVYPKSISASGLRCDILAPAARGSWGAHGRAGSLLAEIVVRERV